MLISAVEIGFGLAFSWLIFAFIEDIQTDLTEFSDYNKTPEKSDNQVYDRTCKLVQTLHTFQIENSNKNKIIFLNYLLKIAVQIFFYFLCRYMVNFDLLVTTNC